MYNQIKQCLPFCSNSVKMKKIYCHFTIHCIDWIFKSQQKLPKKTHPLIVQILSPLLLSRFIWSLWHHAQPPVLSSVKGKRSPHQGFSELRTGTAFPRLPLNTCSYHVQVLSKNTYAKSQKNIFFYCVFFFFFVCFLFVWFSFFARVGIRGEGADVGTRIQEAVLSSSNSKMLL